MMPRPLERPGRLKAPTALELTTPRTATYRAAAPWLDWSGQVGESEGGIAFFDHPANPDYTAGLTGAGYGVMTLRHEYPAGADGRLTLRYRVLVHAGDAAAARVDQRFR